MKIICLSLLFALAVASPLERQTEGGLVVDVPAGAFEPDSEEVTRDDVPAGASVEQVDVSEKDASKEPGRVPLNRDPDSDFFGFRFPTFPSLFVYRRPVIRDPFSSLSGFQPPQPQPYAPGQFDAFSHMETMMQRMQQQMSALWGALLNPGYTVRPRPPVISEEPVVPGDTAAVDETNKSVIKIGDLPANYSNSTSETKVIDGQVVEVNKTIHKVTSNDSSGFFHFQVIKIRPKEPVTDMPTGSVPTEVAHESAGSAPTEAKPESSAAPAFETNEQTTARTPEDPSMNELDGQHQRQQERLVDSFPYLLNRFKDQHTVDEDGRNKLGELDEEDIDIVSQDHPLSKLERREVDLSGDVRVNKILEEQNRKAQLRMINPDAEVFFP